MSQAVWIVAAIAIGRGLWLAFCVTYMLAIATIELVLGLAHDLACNLNPNNPNNEKK